jgi:hypothetical protein
LYENDHDVYVPTDPIATGWEWANYMAKQKGCELASILDQREFDHAVASAYLQNGIEGNWDDDAYGKSKYWIGLYRSMEDPDGYGGNDWKWTDGHELDVTDYDQNTPWKDDYDHSNKDLYGSLAIENCEPGVAGGGYHPNHCANFDALGVYDKNEIADGYLMKCCFAETCGAKVGHKLLR